MSLSIHSAAQTSELKLIVKIITSLLALDQFSLVRTLVDENPKLVNSTDAVGQKHSEVLSFLTLYLSG